MALAYLAATIVAQSGASVKTVVAGETVTQGMPVYKDSVSSKYKKAFADTAAHADCKGIALTASSLNQPLVICDAGDVLYGATDVPKGAPIMVASDAAGNLFDGSVSMTDGMYTTLIGIGISNSTIRLAINASGVTYVAS